MRRSLSLARGFKLQLKLKTRKVNVMKERLLRILAQVDDWAHEDVDILERGEVFRSHLRTIESEAVHGYPGIVKAVQVRSQFVDVNQMRLILSRCLERLKPIPETLSLLLKTSEVATMLGISERSVHRMKSAGELPDVVRVGNSVRWRRDDIEKLIGKVG